MGERSEVLLIRTAETIESEAAEWLAKVDGGNLTEQDRQELRSFLSRGPDHVKALQSYEMLWSDMDVLLSELPNLEADNPQQAASIFSLGRPGFSALASIVFLIIGLLLWGLDPIGRLQIIETSFYSTGIGKQTFEKLSDGSTVHLNTNTVIEIDYSESARTVLLMRGEALFDVAHDPARPFVVLIGDSVVKAVGTKFVVRLTSESIFVTVSEGQVQLSKRDNVTEPDLAVQKQEVVLISEGQEAAAHKKIAEPVLTEIGADALSRRLSWTDRQLVFKDESLEKVVAEVNRYMPGKIIIDDPELRNILINGRFKIGETDALLEAIEVAFDVEARRIDSRTIRISR